MKNHALKSTASVQLNLLLLAAFLVLPPALSFSKVSEGVTLSVARIESGAYLLNGEFSMAVPPASVWAVLTDYEGYAGFIKGLNSCRVSDRSTEGLILEQEGRASFLCFKKSLSLRLRVREFPPECIDFQEEKGKDFSIYRGTWRIVPGENETRVLYELEAKPDFAVPGFILRGKIKGRVMSLLKGLKAEISRRSTAG